MAKHIETVEQTFDLNVFRIAAKCEGVSVIAFDNLRTRMMLWHMLGQYPSKADIGAEIHAGYVEAAAEARTMVEEAGGEPDDITVPSIETCQDQYASGVLKFARANEWPKGTVRHYSAFQKQSVSEGKRSGKGRPKGSTGSKNAEKPTKTETKPAANAESWKDLAVAFSVGVNKAPALRIKPDSKDTLTAEDASQVQDLLRQIVTILATYY